MSARFIDSTWPLYHIFLLCGELCHSDPEDSAGFALSQQKRTHRRPLVQLHPAAISQQPEADQTADSHLPPAPHNRPTIA